MDISGVLKSGKLKNTGHTMDMLIADHLTMDIMKDNTITISDIDNIIK